MAPLKFEDQMKERLEERRMSPSKSSWDQLEAKLNAEDKKSNKNIFWFIGIAASFVGVLLVSVLFFKSSDNNISVEPAVKEAVVNQEKTEELLNDEAVVLEEATKPAQVEEINTQKAQEESLSQKEPILKTPLKKSSAIVENTVQEEVHQAHENPNELLAQREDHIVEELTLEDQKIKEVAKAIKEMQASKMALTDSDIDSLLIKAQRELHAEKKHHTTETVNAKSLLQEVEQELDEGFRDKVFKAILSGYDTVKEAVAQRNN